VKRDGEIFRVKLVKYDFLDYLLSVTSLRTKSKFNRRLDRLPFEEE
jgi:hypothetical protein